jgi:hypothetical protein
VETIPVLFLMTILVFSLVLFLPGDPVLGMLGPAAQVDQTAVAKLRSDLNLDKPIPVQYVTWLNNLLHGDMGRSIASKQPVADAILHRLPATTYLAAFPGRHKTEHRLGCARQRVQRVRFGHPELLAGDPDGDAVRGEPALVAIVRLCQPLR